MAIPLLSENFLPRGCVDAVPDCRLRTLEVSDLSIVCTTTSGEQSERHRVSFALFRATLYNFRRSTRSAARRSVSEFFGCCWLLIHARVSCVVRTGPLKTCGLEEYRSPSPPLIIVAGSIT